MTEKAELDILEVDLPGMGDGPGGDGRPEDEDRGTAKRNHLLKRGLLAVLVLLLCGGGVASWMYFGPDRTGDVRKTLPVPAVSPGDRWTALDHFSVNLKDGQGNYRVLVCDVVLELNRGWETARDKSLDLRKIVYKTVRTNSAPILQKSPKIRRQLLKEIEKEVNGALGEGAVKHVYFTKYILL